LKCGTSYEAEFEAKCKMQRYQLMCDTADNLGTQKTSHEVKLGLRRADNITRIKQSKLNCSEEQMDILH
jgi:hypothetical protein